MIVNSIVSAGEYLNSSYHPEREYSDGLLVERGEPTIGHALPVPLPAGKIVDSIPRTVIEILSPEDRFSEQLARFRDYIQIGVLHMVLLDPEELIAYHFENRALIEAQLISLELPTGDLPFDTEALFRQLEEERHEGVTLS